MMTQGFVVDFMAKPANAPGEVRKKETPNTGSYPKFGDTLNTAAQKLYSRQNDRNTWRDTTLKAETGKESGMDRKIKSFKDAVKVREQTPVSEEVKDVENKLHSSTDSIQKEAEKELNEAEVRVVEDSIAQVLNISVEELRKVLKVLNIKPEELADEAKSGEFADKISNLFGLSSEQKETLVKITEFTVKEAKTFVSRFETEGEKLDVETSTQGKDDWVKLEGVDVEVVENEKKTPDLEELGKKFKEILGELKTKLQSEPQKLYEGISDKVEEVAEIQLKLMSGNSPAETETVEDANSSIPQDNKDDKAVKISNDSGKSGNSEEESTDNQKADRLNSPKVEAGNRTEVDGMDAEHPKFNNVLSNQENKANVVSEASEVQKEMPVTKKEIISQIVEKAKVVLSGDKSEMVIDLKPDHLGKLALKVVTERGAVIAKFVAENDQVKAAIEANMDSLKQSLEKHGYSIQGFSVSVGKEPKKGFAQDYGMSKKNNKGSNNGKLITSTISGTSAVMENQHKLNPYLVNDSSIDLTA